MQGASSAFLGRGVFGRATHASGATTGVWGESASPTGQGVFGWATAPSGQAVGVVGESDSASGQGVYGFTTATSGANEGVRGQSPSTSGRGVFGLTTASTGANDGVRGQSPSTGGRGVFGWATASTGFTFGVLGVSRSINGHGVYGEASASSGVNYGVYGRSDSAVGYAGWFQGQVHVTGRLTKGAGSFKIDHPLDPANQYLSHSFVESPDMMNIYNGNVTLDAGGEAWVPFPDWFQALNRDFRYQLTSMGAPGPNLYVAEEIAGNRFKIAGGHPGGKVSWQVTGIRKDPYAEKHRIPVEEKKPPVERGFYLHPDVHGQPETKGLPWARDPEGMSQRAEARKKLVEEGERLEVK